MKYDRDPQLIAQKTAEFILWLTHDGSDLEIRFRHSYDGKTTWHAIGTDAYDGPADAHGFLPWQIDYRLKKPAPALTPHLDIAQPPVAACDTCGRKTWSNEPVCGMPQPNGTKCPGHFVLSAPHGAEKE